MRNSISFLAIGSELLDGRVHESNALFAAQELSTYGISLAQTHCCDDSIEEIVDSIQFLGKRAKTILISGGLGPTSDDLTRESVAALCSSELELNHDVLENLKKLYAQRQRIFDPTNTKQALFPRGSHIIPNPIGTAAGFSVQFSLNAEPIQIYSLPGVPREFYRMFNDTVLPEIIQKARIAPLSKRIARFFGQAESIIGGVIQKLELDPSITISYRATFPEIQVVLKTDQSEESLNQAHTAVIESVGRDYCFSESRDENFEASLHKILVERNVTLSVAESCSGGFLSSLLTNTPGSSSYFLGGIISYANHAKIDLLGVDSETIQQHGAVSGFTALEMATQVRKKFNSDFGLSITGIAGPDGGSTTKPVGTFFIGLSSASHNRSFPLYFSGNREQIRRFSSYAALDTLRRTLLGLPYSTYGWSPAIKSEV